MKTPKFCGVQIAALLLLLPVVSWAAEVDVAKAVADLKQVGPGGKGSEAGRAAWRQLSSAEPAQLPQLLAALDTAGQLEANWLHAAIDAVAESAQQKGQGLPTEGLEAFLQETKHEPRARRKAFEVLCGRDPSTRDRWIPLLLDDPSLELRRDAVGQLLNDAGKLTDKPDAAKATYQKALSAARDLDQVQSATAELKKLGETVSLPTHFGFLLDWKLIGPFDNREKKGFAVAYPPELQKGEVEAAAKYPGKEGPLAWSDYHSGDEYGAVDLNMALGKHMGAAGYAWTEFYSRTRRAVELRIGSDSAIRVWVNGQSAADFEVYHSFVRMDQYTVRATLQPGRNTILLKVCQNEQTEDWAQDWKFQLRVCDAVGTAIPSDNKTAAQASIEVPADRLGKGK